MAAPPAQLGARKGLDEERVAQLLVAHHRDQLVFLVPCALLRPIIELLANVHVEPLTSLACARQKVRSQSRVVDQLGGCAQVLGAPSLLRLYLGPGPVVSSPVSDLGEIPHRLARDQLVALGLTRSRRRCACAAQAASNRATSASSTWLNTRLTPKS